MGAEVRSRIAPSEALPHCTRADPMSRVYAVYLSGVRSGGRTMRGTRSQLTVVDGVGQAAAHFKYTPLGGRPAEWHAVHLYISQTGGPTPTNLIEFCQSPSTPLEN
jgi:hypothetical protein